MRSSLKAGCQTNAWNIAPNDANMFSSVLRQIRDLGFAGVETSFRNLSNFAANGDCGSKFFAVHIFLNDYDRETCLAPRELVEDVVAKAARLGAEHVVLSGAPATDTARLKAKTGALTRFAELAAKSGLGMAYHNHAPELAATLGGQSELELLLQQTAGSPLQLVFDAGHAFRAGLVVAELVTKISARMTAIHLRDFRGNEQVPLGTGEFPLADVAATLKSCGWSGWLVAEEERSDGSKPGWDAVVTAREALRKCFKA